MQMAKMLINGTLLKYILPLAFVLDSDAGVGATWPYLNKDEMTQLTIVLIKKFRIKEINKKIHHSVFLLFLF